MKSEAMELLQAVVDGDVDHEADHGLEELAELISGDWGGSIQSSRAVVLAAYRLGRRHEWIARANQP